VGGIIAGVAVAVTADGGFGSSPARVIARSRLFRLSTEVSCTCCCIAGADALVVGVGGGCGVGGDIVPDSDPAEADVPPPPPSSTSNSAHSHEILYFELIVYNAVATSFVEEDGGGGD